MKRVELEKVIATGVQLVDHISPDVISLQTDDGFSFDVKTYRLLDADVEALREAILDGGEKVRIVLEVDDE